MRCELQNPDQDTHGRAIARLTAVPSGQLVTLCKSDLDWWLDSADDDSVPEPSALTFFASTRR